MSDKELMQMALDALETICGYRPRSKVDIPGAMESLRARLAEPEGEPTFKPDWSNYRQGLADGRAQAIEDCARAFARAILAAAKGGKQ